jgi:hypothetical protein
VNSTCAVHVKRKRRIQNGTKVDFGLTFLWNESVARISPSDIFFLRVYSEEIRWFQLIFVSHPEGTILGFGCRCLLWCFRLSSNSSRWSIRNWRHRENPPFVFKNGCCSTWEVDWIIDLIFMDERYLKTHSRVTKIIVLDDNFCFIGIGSIETYDLIECINWQNKRKCLMNSPLVLKINWVSDPGSILSVQLMIKCCVNGQR